MKPKYQHTQKPGLPFFAVMIPVIVAFLIIDIEDIPSVWILPPACLLFAWTLMLFYSLTVTIDETYLRVRFGPGVFFKKFRLSDIAECGTNYRTYIWGWGIRWYIKGWLYNIAGFKSVEIIFKNGKKRRIGTDEPEKLADAIRSVIA